LSAAAVDTQVMVGSRADPLCVLGLQYTVHT